MVDIRHRIGVKDVAPDRVYEALTTVPGLAGWWTEDTSGSADPGGLLAFRFPPVGGFDMRVLEAEPGRRVSWLVVDGPAEWIGTTVEWQLRQGDDVTVVLFTHRDWKEPGEFMHHCSTKWGTFLMSLKALLETGTGAPAPHDVEISDWH